MENLTARPISPETQSAYGDLAMRQRISSLIMADLAMEFDRGAFCPENQHITSFRLGQISVVQYLAQRLSEAIQPQKPLPERIEHGH